MGCAHGCDKKGESVELPIPISLWRATANPAETALVKVLVSALSSYWTPLCDQGAGVAEK